MSFLNIILIFIIFILFLLFVNTYIKLNKLSKEFYEFKRNKYRDSNKIVMLEYYMRNYKENHGNIYTLVRDLYDLIYNN